MRQVRPLVRSPGIRFSKGKVWGFCGCHNQGEGAAGNEGLSAGVFLTPTQHGMAPAMDVRRLSLKITGG